MPLYKRIFWRFVRGFITGSLSVITTIQIAHVTTFGEAAAFLATVLTAAVIGGLNGSLLALDKYMRSYE